MSGSFAPVKRLAGKLPLNEIMCGFSLISPVKCADFMPIEGLRIRVCQVQKNTIFRIWYQNVHQNFLCSVPMSTMLCFARIILQRAKCAIALRTMHELLGANSTMYIGHYLGLLQVGP